MPGRLSDSRCALVSKTPSHSRESLPLRAFFRLLFYFFEYLKLLTEDDGSSSSAFFKEFSRPTLYRLNVSGQFRGLYSCLLLPPVFSLDFSPFDRVASVATVSRLPLFVSFCCSIFNDRTSRHTYGATLLVYHIQTTLSILFSILAKNIHRNI